MDAYVLQVVSVDDLPPRSVQYQYHLLETSACLGEGMEWSEETPVRSFLKAGKLIPLDTLSFTNGPCTEVFGKYVFYSKCVQLLSCCLNFIKLTFVNKTFGTNAFQ